MSPATSSTPPSAAGERAIRTVGVVGGGALGCGIAQAAVQAGFPVRLRETTEAGARRAHDTVERALDRLAQRGGGRGALDPAQRAEALARLEVTTLATDLVDCDLVIEAVAEDLATKTSLWRELDAFCVPATIFATTTSHLAIAALAAATAREDRTVGLHFLPPAASTPLVEVVRAVTTSDATAQAVTDFVRRLGKEPVAAKDRPGFVVNRLLVPYLLDAVRALEEGVASVADLDRAMRLGAGHARGPFAQLDQLGLDVVQRMADALWEETRDARFAPPPLLRRLVLAGMHGRRTGRGFWDYTTEPPTPNERLAEV